MAITATSATSGQFDSLGLNEIGATPKTANEKASDTASADRFLTMLVTQLKNQDPLNPMDNAQITSQMAQINAVTGLEKVNESIKTLSSQILQMQAMQGASLVGRSVSIEGNALAVADGKGTGMIELDGKATTTNVEVLNASGKVIGTVSLGAKEAGRYSFEWPSGTQTANSGLTFRLAATNGSVAVDGRTLVSEKVTAVAAGTDGLQITLQRSGTIPASKVVAYN